MGGNKVLIVARAGSWLALATVTELSFSKETEVLRVNYEATKLEGVVAALKGLIRCNLQKIEKIIIPFELYELALKWDDLKSIHSPVKTLHQLIGRYGEILWCVFDNERSELHQLRRNSLYIEPKSGCRLRVSANKNDTGAKQGVSAQKPNKTQQ